MHLTILNEASPRIVKTQSEWGEHSFVDISFPDSGTVWRYSATDQALLQDLLARYRRNAGRLVSKLRDSGRFVAVNVTKEYAKKS